MAGFMVGGNVEWLRERAQAIRVGDRPTTEEEWQAAAAGLDMIADLLEKAFPMLGRLSDE